MEMISYFLNLLSGWFAIEFNQIKRKEKKLGFTLAATTTAHTTLASTSFLNLITSQIWSLFTCN
jgi:hypothetical protein